MSKSINKNMNDEDPTFDFGFTVVNESELEVVQSAGQSEVKLHKLYNAIKPLLTNLKKDADKEYILWPDRVEKIVAFEKFIKGIVND